MKSVRHAPSRLRSSARRRRFLYELLEPRIALNGEPVVDLSGASPDQIPPQPESIDYSDSAFFRGGGAVLIVDVPRANLPGLTIRDSDSSHLASATATISEIHDSSSESLLVDTSGTGISAVYEAPTLTLEGQAPIAEYEQVLRTLRYDNVASNPTLLDREVRVVVNDGVHSSVAATSNISIVESLTLVVESARLDPSASTQSQRVEVIAEVVASSAPKVGGFQLELSLPTQSDGVEFASVLAPTSHPYAFDNQLPASEVDAGGAAVIAGDFLLDTSAAALESGAGLLALELQVDGGVPSGTSVGLVLDDGPTSFIAGPRPNEFLPFSIRNGRIDVANPLQVSSLTPQGSGFTVEFSTELETAALNLFDTERLGLGGADVVLQGSQTGNVAGSIVVALPPRSLTFIATDGPLAADVYSVTLKSGPNGLRSIGGALLDGNSDGEDGDDYLGAFTVASPAPDAVIVGIPHFVRGPGQDVNVPADSSDGIPLTISNGTGVTAVELSISYDPAMLEFHQAEPAAAMPAGTTVRLDDSATGTISLIITSPSALDTGLQTLANLSFSVPSSDPQPILRRGQVLDIGEVTAWNADGATVPTLAGDALHISAYFGDVSGNARLNASDAARVARVAAIIDSGFAVSPLTDPMVLGDVTRNRRLNAGDASVVARAAALISVPEIPPIPAGGGVNIGLVEQGQPQAPDARPAPEKPQLPRERKPIESHSIANLASAVEEVLVRGESWNEDFLQRLSQTGTGDGGFLLSPMGSSIPWTAINEILVRFDRDVAGTVEASSLLVRGAAIQQHPIGGFSYDPETFTASWQLAAPMFEADEIAVVLGAVDPAGNLDLEVIREFQTIPGDVDGDGKVTIDDGGELRERLFATALDGRYAPPYDLDGDGIVDIFDGLLVRNALFQSAPLDRPDLEPVAIIATAPTHGAELVGVLGRATIYFSDPVDPNTITTDSFKVVAAAHVPGKIEIASNGLSADYVYETPLSPSTNVRVVVDSSVVHGQDGLPLDGDGDGRPAGAATFEFQTVPLARIPSSTVSGRVLDSRYKTPDGSSLPIEGATIQVAGLPQLSAATDQDGFFRLEDVPVPELVVEIDARTVKNAPPGVRYRRVISRAQSVAGQETELQLDGAPFDIYLPPLEETDAQILSSSERTEVRLGPAGLAHLSEIASEVDPNLWSRTVLHVAPGTILDDSGSRADSVTLTPVASNRLPVPVPANLNPAFVISVEAGSATRFESPLPISFPNTTGLLTGERASIVSFSQGEWRVTGAATVSSDESVFISDQGQGIVAPGFHFIAPGAVATGGTIVSGVGNAAAPSTGLHYFSIRNRGTGEIVYRFSKLLSAGEDLAIPSLGGAMLLSPSTTFEQTVVNVDTLEIGTSEFTTPDSGTVFELPSILVSLDTSPDPDDDGLPDLSESVVGTLRESPDSDLDGTRDLAELHRRLDPLSNSTPSIGLQNSVPLLAGAMDVVVASAPPAGEHPGAFPGSLAFVATGPHGLAIVDVSNPILPITMGQLELPGENSSVAVDLARSIAVVTGNETGLHVVDVSAPSRPVLMHTVQVGASLVELFDGFAYTTFGSQLSKVDLESLEQIQTVSLTNTFFIDLVREGAILYAMDGSDTLRAVDISSEMEFRDSVRMPDTRGSLFVGDGTAYLAAARNSRGGFSTVDVSNPASFTVLSGPDVASPFRAPAIDIAVDGSGLALLLGRSDGQEQVRLFDVTDPTDTAQFVGAPIAIGLEPRRLAIAAGTVVVVSGTAETALSTVYHVNHDGQLQAPTVSTSVAAVDADLDTPGLQVVEGDSLLVTVDVTEDIQVRHVSLLYDGQMIADDITFPYEFATVVPRNPGASVSMSVVASDLAGSFGASEELVFEILPDVVPPDVVESTPSDGSNVFAVPSLDIQFTEPLDTSGFDASGIMLVSLGPDGVPNGDDTSVAIGSVQLQSRDKRIVVAPQIELASGHYQLTVSSSAVRDLAGNPMRDDFEFRFTIRPPSSIQATSGSPRFAQAPSANAGQTIAVEVPWSNAETKVRFPIVSDQGLESLRVVDAVGLIGHDAYVTVPADAFTGDILIYASATTDFDGFDQWTVTRGSVDLIGTDTGGDARSDVLPGNGLYLDLAGSAGGGRLETTTEFVLDAGLYELSFDLAGSQTNSGSADNLVTVSLGSVFSELFARETFDPFSTVTRTINVLEKTTARLVFDHAGNDGRGLKLDNVRLLPAAGSPALLDDDFEFVLPGGPFLLQIVPTISDMEVESNGTFDITGTGFVEGHNSIYRLGEVEVVDFAELVSPWVAGTNTTASISFPSFTADAFGVTSVTTAGGTSESYSVGVAEIDSVALSGSPAIASEASANAGQMVTLRGSNFSESLDIVLKYQNEDETVHRVLEPVFVSPDGTAAIFEVYRRANGAFPLLVPGSPSRQLLQVVPVLTSATVSPASTARIIGNGLTRSATYSFNGLDVVVDDERESQSVQVPLPVHGLGEVTARTDGGTSNPAGLNFLHPSLGPFDSVAKDPISGDLFVIADSHVSRINPATLAVTTYEQINVASGDLQVLRTRVVLGQTAIDAGSLLVFHDDGSVQAVDSRDGTVLATLPANVNVNFDGGAYNPTTNSIFLLSRSPVELVEIDPADGTEIRRVDLYPIQNEAGGLTVDPVTGHLWILGPELVEITPDGVREVLTSGAPRNVSDLGWDSSRQMLASSTDGVVYVFGINRAPPPPPPVVTGVIGEAAGGTPANDSIPSANTGQVIELIGDNFTPLSRVSFPVRRTDGVSTRAMVELAAVSADGTRLQVVVPDAAETGEIALSPLVAGTENLGIGRDEDAVYRDVRAEFTAESDTVTIEFLARVHRETDDQSWGIDNVRILRRSDGEVVFEDNFESELGLDWASSLTDSSLTTTLTTFAGRFRFNSQSLALSVESHERYLLEFDLYLFDGWNIALDDFGIVIDGRGTPLVDLSSASFGGTVLQIVPIVERLSGIPGNDRTGTFQPLGTGFRGENRTVTVGGVVKSEVYALGEAEPSFLNGITIEGPVRVETVGGSDEIPGPEHLSFSFVKLAGIQATAAAGTPSGAGPSANTGQTITLAGLGFTDGTKVQFDALNDAGAVGTVTRFGDANPEGTRLEVIVPAVARTGMVSVVGDDTRLPLRIVPTLRSIGGAVSAGTSILLEGTGLITSELAVSIDGRPAVDVRRTNTLSEKGLDQQIVTLTVPARATGEVVEVTTSGGSFRLLRGAEVTDLPDEQLSNDVGDSFGTSRSLGLPINSRVTLAANIGDSGTDEDVDLFRIMGNAGDRLTVDLKGIDDFSGATYLRLFDELGNAVGRLSDAPGGERRISTGLPATGPYFVGVSGWRNTSYDPAVPGSGRSGAEGTYELTVERVDGGSITLGAIPSAATTGTPRRAEVPSANVGQTITVAGRDFRDGPRLVFSSVESRTGELTTILAAPLSVADDGQSVQVVVPDEATSGMVRLEHDGSGLFLQIVPELQKMSTGLSNTNDDRSMVFVGSGFAMGQMVANLGQVSVAAGDVDDSDGGPEDNDTYRVSVPRSAPLGPVTISSLGGTSSPVELIFSEVRSIANSGTPADAALPSANPGQAIVLIGSGFEDGTTVFFVGSEGEQIAAQPVAVYGNKAMSVLVPGDAVTGEVSVSGDQGDSRYVLQVIPTVSAVELDKLMDESVTLRLTGTGLADSSVYHFGTRSVSDIGSNVDRGLVQTAFSEDLFGPVTVTSAGGTSAPFVVGIDSVDSEAFSGAPLNSAEASANPGQVVLVRGTNLTETTDIYIRYFDEGGVARTQKLAPSLVSVDGTVATFAAPPFADEFKVLTIGGAQQPRVQVVPAESSGTPAGAPELARIESAAIDGTPADANLASANVAQPLELVGSNFTASSRVLFSTRDNAGLVRPVAVAPTAVSTDGSRLQVVVPDLAETGDVQVVDTGAGSEDLGFQQPVDSIYREIRVAFTAGDAFSELQFSDGGLSTAQWATWGIDNVRVVAQSDQQVIFEDDFEGGADLAWTQTTTDASLPTVFTQFSGRFANDSQSLRIPVAQGEEYVVALDLYVIDGWDGGSERFNVGVDGVTLFSESFNNLGDTQSYHLGISESLPLQVVPVASAGNYEHRCAR